MKVSAPQIEIIDIKVNELGMSLIVSMIVSVSINRR